MTSLKNVKIVGATLHGDPEALRRVLDNNMVNVGPCLTPRTRIAMAVLPALLSSGHPVEGSIIEAYKIADLMLEKNKEGQ